MKQTTTPGQATPETTERLVKMANDWLDQSRLNTQALFGEIATTADKASHARQRSYERLVEIAHDWLDQDRPNTRELIRGVTTTADEVARLAIDPALAQHRPCYRSHESLGLLISELWNNCEEKVINFSHDAPFVNYLGVDLRDDKVLLVRGTAGDHAGMNSKGVVLVTGTAGYGLGAIARGTVITDGRIDKEAGMNGTGVLITLAPTRISPRFRGRHIGHQECELNPRFEAYVTRLLSYAKHKPSAIEREFGDARQINAALQSFMGTDWRRHW